MHSVRQFILGPENEYLAVSRGIDEADLSEICQWSGKSGDLVSEAPMAHSWNFHPLPTGSFCLSRTNRAALLFPKADPSQVFTHGILIPQSLLKDYANNVMLLARHLEKLGFWRAGLEVTRQLLSASESEPRKRENSSAEERSLPVLRTLTMDGGADAVRLNSLNAFVRTTGIRRFCSILDQVLGNFSTIVTGNAVPEMLLEALLDALPIGCRLEISFSTGLRFSPDRFFRVVFVGNSLDEQKKIQHEFTLPMISSTSISLMQDQLLPALQNRWAMFIATLFEQNKEMEWGEIAVLDETHSLSELSKRARFWFRKLGLETIYQKIRESRKNGSLSSDESYGIFRTRVSGAENVQKILTAILRNLPSEREKESANDENGMKVLDSGKFRALTEWLEVELLKLRKCENFSDESTPKKQKAEVIGIQNGISEELPPLDEDLILKLWESEAIRELIHADPTESAEQEEAKEEEAGKVCGSGEESGKKVFGNENLPERDSDFGDEFCEKTELFVNNTPKKGEIVMPRAMNSYLATLSEAMHGNPLAQNHLKNVFQEITSGVSEVQKEKVSETLLREGVRSWNEERNSMRNSSWRQIEEMVDTLSMVLNLPYEDEK